MRHRSFIALAISLVVLLACAAAVYAYDSGRKDQIAKGVSVAGIDIGGMTRAKAERTLRRELAAPLERTLVVRYHDRRFRLSAKRAKLHVDVKGSAAEAVSKSRGGNIVTRAWRGLTGGSVDAQLEPRISYSRAAVNRLVKRVTSTLDQDPKDASLSFSGSGFTKVDSEPGVKVEAGELRHDVQAALVNPDSRRVVRAHSTVTKPSVTTGELAQKYPVFLIVNRDTKQLRLYKDLKLAHTYRIAVGMIGLETPAGLYHIQNKVVNPAWHVPNSAWAGKLAGKVIPGGAPNNPIKARWMGIFDGAGIHGTDELSSLGSAASHGCIRMAIPDVENLFDQVSVGSPVFIA